MKLNLPDEAATRRLGERLAESVFAERATPWVIGLSGPLGAGKTVLARGFIFRWLDLCGEQAPEQVPSPTFNIARVYGSARPVAHLDLYRVSSMEELENIGIAHYLNDYAVCLVEWWDKFSNSLGSLAGARRSEVILASLRADVVNPPSTFSMP